MEKIMLKCSLLFLLLTIVCSVAWSMDFVNMSNEELFELRGAIQNAPDTDKQYYQLEWEKRVAGMKPEEKKQFTESSKDGEKINGEPKLPFHIIGQGYGKQEGEGQVIIGGFPENSPKVGR